MAEYKTLKERLNGFTGDYNFEEWDTGFLKMKIEKATLADLPDILQLQYLAYQSEAKLLNNYNIPPLKQTLEEIIAEYHKGIILKAVRDDKVIIGSVRAYAENHTLFIGKLMVRPDFQGQGIGTRLLKEIEKICPQPRYELFTSDKSERNLKLYERLGYVRFKNITVSSDLTFIYLEKSQTLWKS